MKMRISIKSTYDSQKEGLQYSISTSVNGKSINDSKDIPDPFVNHTVKLSFRDTFKGLLRGGVVVGVFINGKNNRIVEDVLELDDQYLGNNATRREDFNKEIMSKAVEHIDQDETEQVLKKKRQDRSN